MFFSDEITKGVHSLTDLLVRHLKLYICICFVLAINAAVWLMVMDLSQKDIKDYELLTRVLESGFQWSKNNYNITVFLK